MCKFFSVTLSVAKGLGPGGTLTPDVPTASRMLDEIGTSPLRLAQHDISVWVDENGLTHKKHAHGVN